MTNTTDSLVPRVPSSFQCCTQRKEGKCKTWTLDSGLDSWTGLWTEIWTRFWIDAQFNDDHFQETADRRYCNCKLVTSSLVPRPFKGPGYEAKSQGTGLEATCKHVEVEVNISLGKSVRDVTNYISRMNFSIT